MAPPQATAHASCNRIHRTEREAAPRQHEITYVGLLAANAKHQRCESFRASLASNAKRLASSSHCSRSAADAASCRSRRSASYGFQSGAALGLFFGFDSFELTNILQVLGPGSCFLEGDKIVDAGHRN